MTRRASRRQKRRALSAGGGTRWRRAGGRTRGRTWTRCRRRDVLSKTGWACRTGCCGGIAVALGVRGPGGGAAVAAVWGPTCLGCWATTSPVWAAGGNGLWAARPGCWSSSRSRRLRLDGSEWTMASVEAQYGRVLLCCGGEGMRRSIRWLAHHPDCRARPGPGRGAGEDAGPAAGSGRPDRSLARGRRPSRRAPAGGGDRVTRRGPVIPVQRSRGSPITRGSPLGQRRRAKAANLGPSALGRGGAGAGKVSERTIKRIPVAWRLRDPAGCIAAGGCGRASQHHARKRGRRFAVRKETRGQGRRHGVP
jgi:hypothetical protein